MEVQETIRLFDEKPYDTTFTGKVLSSELVEENGKTRCCVILDQTLFFPEEGGQSPDLGTLGGVPVVDVQIKKDVITHVLEEALPDTITVGSTVEGEIDWQHRFYNMQQHTGEHIFSGIVHGRYGYENVGFHLSDSIVTMDFNGVIDSSDIEDIEDEVNMVIAKNLPVEVSYPSKEQLESMEYRSKIEIEGQVRIVTIPGYDVCACCAPHVKHTGEIGILKVMSVQSYKGGIRVSILCGFRALEAFRQKDSIVSTLMGLFSTNQEALADNVSKLKSANQSLKSQLAAAKQEIMEYKIANLPTDIDNAILFEKELETPVMRSVVNSLVEQYKGVSAIFVGDDEEGYQFIIGSKEYDCRLMATALRNKLEAKGGGSAVMVQGSLKASKEDIERVMDEVIGN